MFSGIFKFLCNSRFFAGICIVVMCNSLFAAELRVTQPWVKEAPPGARANAAYMRLFNPTDTPIIIQSISADCCAELMLHRTLYKNDRAIMEHVDEITVPANTGVVMEPGGLHIMLMRFKSPLVAGDIIKLQLHFANGDQQVIQLPVKAYGDQ